MLDEGCNWQRSSLVIRLVRLGSDWLQVSCSELIVADLFEGVSIVSDGEWKSCFCCCLSFLQ